MKKQKVNNERMEKEVTAEEKPKARWSIAVVRGKTGAGKETYCVRCMGCEAICSFTKERLVNPELSRIKVIPKELEWIEGKSKRIVSHVVCRQCPEVAPCMKACPVDGAMSRDEEWGTVLIDESKCTRCQECITACPFDAIWYDELNDKIIKCDLCGGSPQCVEWCPVGALTLKRWKEKVISE
jgi:Fe-S-cluster-containing dehydrogenase component